MERMQTKISADEQIRWGDVFLAGSCVGNLELPREQKETNYDETKSWAQTQTAANWWSPGAAKAGPLKDSYFHWMVVSFGKPGTRFLLDNSKKSHAQNDNPLQPTAATAIDGHVAINRSNVATSPSNPCALLVPSYSPSLAMLFALFLSHRSIVPALTENLGRTRETEVEGITRTHKHTRTTARTQS